MAHESQMRFFRDVVSRFPGHFSGRVLDIGSLDINGGPHTLIDPAQYVGVDLGMGPNVDLVARGEALDFPDGHFDVAMSSECFEHNREWRATLLNMIRMTREGGLIVFTAAGTGRAEHGTTRSDGGFAAPLVVASGDEWYRNLTPRDVDRVIADRGLSPRLCLAIRSTSDVIFLGVKGRAPSGVMRGVEEIRIDWRVVADSSRYSGRRSRRLALLIAGDRGLAAHDRSLAWLKRALMLPGSARS